MSNSNKDTNSSGPTLNPHRIPAPYPNIIGQVQTQIPCEVLSFCCNFSGIDRAIDVKHDQLSMNHNGAKNEIIFLTLK